MDFQGKRSKLYSEFSEIREGKIPEQMKREFWSFIEQIIISLYNDENSYFGQFLIQVKREIRLDIKWPLATKPDVSGFIMYFNPLLILDLDLSEIQALLKHEVYHIMMNHYERELSLKNKFSKEAISTAIDIAINQYIKNLPTYCKRLNTVNLQYNLELNGDMPMEKYVEEIQKVINHRKKYAISKDDSSNKDSLIDQEHAHDVWSEANVSADTLDQITKKTAINAYKGKAPKDIEKVILLMKEKPEIEWYEVLRNLLPSVKSGYRKTITRKDRRMPDRLDLRGKLPNSVPKILIAMDISASMSDKEIENIIVEVLGIVKNKNTEIKVIECDNEIRKVYDLKGVKDIKPRSKKNGSTKFSPVFKYIKDNNLRNHILIYFTDGVGEKQLEVKPINYKTLWVLTGEESLSLEKPYGMVKRLTREKKESYGATYGLQELRESIWELRETIHD